MASRKHSKQRLSAWASEIFYREWNRLLTATDSDIKSQLTKHRHGDLNKQEHVYVVQHVDINKQERVSCMCTNENWCTKQTKYLPFNRNL